MNENLKEYQSITHVKRRKELNNFKKERASNIGKKTGNKKLHVKQKAQDRRTKKSCTKVTKKFTTPKIVLREPKKTYNSEIHSTMDVLTKPLNGTILTSDELKTLFAKYKVDGHYKASGNSLTVSAILNNQYDDKSILSCNMTDQYKYINEISQNTWQSNTIKPTNMCYNTENQHAGENTNTQQGLRYDSWKHNREILGPINISDTGDNRAPYYEQNSLVDNNCKHQLFVSRDMQTYCDSFVSSTTQNLDQASKSNNFTTDEGYPNNLYNNGFHIDKWNGNSMSMIKNNNLPHNSSDLSTQPWNAVASTELETYHDGQYDINNSTIYQPTNASVDKDFSEDGSSFNRYTDTSMYSPTVDDENFKCTSNSYDVNVQQDFSSFAYDNSRYAFNSLPIISNTPNFMIETNTFATLSVGITGQYT